MDGACQFWVIHIFIGDETQNSKVLLLRSYACDQFSPF